MKDITADWTLNLLYLENIWRLRTDVEHLRCFRDLWGKLHPLKPFAIDSAYYKLDIDSLMHRTLTVSEPKKQTYLHILGKINTLGC